MHRRPVIEPKDVGAVVNVKIGSGAVLPGIYMYHGGMNPGRRLNESRSAGDGTDTPEFNYDFQAPVGSFGKPSPVYAELRRMFTFLRDFGESLAVMPAVFPEDNPTDPLDLAHLRYCFRTEGKSGFVFVNNHVRGYETARHTRTFRFPTGDGEVEFPEMTFESGDYGFYPCNMPVGDATLVSANAQPLCILNGKTWVFFTDRKPEYRIQGDLGDAEILTLSEADSLRASKVTVGGRDWLLLCDAPYTQDGDAITFLCRKDTVLKVWPAPDGMTADADGFAAIPLAVPKRACEVGVRLFSENPLMREYALEIPAVPEDAADMILTLDYDGSIAELWRGDEKLADQYSLGSGWQIGMRRYGGGDFLLRVFALAESAPVYMEKRPRFRNGTACCLKDAGAEIEYAVRLESLKTVVRTGDAGAEGFREGEEAR